MMSECLRGFNFELMHVTVNKMGGRASELFYQVKVKIREGRISNCDH
jgi:hypothetical protein